jgi:hypothetical protein
MTLRELINGAEDQGKSILDAQVFIDCLEGDKFAVSSVSYDNNHNSLTLKLHKGDRGWIGITYKHPIKW